MEHIIFDQLYFSIFKKKKNLKNNHIMVKKGLITQSFTTYRHSTKYCHTRLIKFSQKFYKIGILPFVL